MQVVIESDSGFNWVRGRYGEEYMFDCKVAPENTWCKFSCLRVFNIHQYGDIAKYMRDEWLVFPASEHIEAVNAIAHFINNDMKKGVHYEKK